MRAMILAAGLGTRLRPLTELRAKPALPVRGIPVIAYLLELLHHHGIDDVVVNLYHQPDSIRAAIEAFAPTGMRVSYSPEPAPLGTGGGIRRAAGFLCESETSIVLAGDMILDLDLTALISRHQSRGDLATLVLREDPRAGRFGTIGIDGGGGVRRIAGVMDLGGEKTCGVFIGARVFSREILETLPERDEFEDLRGWLMPALEADETRIRGEVFAPEQCLWEPVGTPDEYMQANLEPRTLSFMNADEIGQRHGTRFEMQNVLGSGCEIHPDAQVRRCVVWENERIPADTSAEDGVFAGGAFHSCRESVEGERD